MFAVGHLALGYLTGKATAKSLNVDLNVSLAFFASVLPDVDLLIPGLTHRGPMHSFVVYVLIFLPFFILYGRRSLVYFVCVSQHIVLGDFLTAGNIGYIQLLWPLTSDWYGTGFIVTGLDNIALEWLLFSASFYLILKTKDVKLLLQRHLSNWMLTVPIVTIVLPVFFNIPLHAPLALFIPHMIFLALFSLSIIVDLKSALQNI